MSSEKYTTDEIQKMIVAIRSKDHTLRQNALANLAIIAKVLEPERTVKELIPYTIETIDHNGKDRSIIGAVLCQLLPYIGGTQHIQVLFDALRTLCEDEDVLVREPATESLVSIGNQIPESEFGVLVQFAKELCEDQWYPLRCSGATICCKLYQKFPQKSRQDINKELTRLASDTVVLVRCSLAISLHNIISAGAIDLASTILTTLSKDESAAVSIELPQSIALIAKANPSLALSVSETIFNTEIWQSKSVLLDYLDQIFQSNPPKEFLKKVAKVSISDPHNVIRASIARLIAFIYNSGCLPFEEFQKFVTSLISDSESCVRIAVAQSLGKMKPIKKGSFDESTLDTLLNDEELDVRMEALKSVAATGKAISLAAKNLSELLTIASWRTKRNVADLFPSIANIYDDKKFNSEMMPIVKALLTDDANDVREEMCKILNDLVKKYGAKWQKDTIYPLINELVTSPDYQLRKTAIQSIASISAFDDFKSALETLAKDSVPNVRMVLARSLPRGNTLLNTLKNDSDQDVNSCANQQ